jgi:hypothetical protein
MLVTTDQRVPRQYAMLTQSKDFSPETRARFHASTPKLGDAENDYLFCLHLSLFLFAAGLLIYFFNINRATFDAVVWFIATLTLAYTLVSVSPIYDREFLIVTPFSTMALWAYLCVLYAIGQVSRITPLHGLSIQIKKHHRDLREHFRAGIVEGNAKWFREEALKPSSEIDAEVLERILLVLDDDHSLESFFDAVPGFCGSKLVQPLYSRVTTKLQQSLDGFLDRTFSSRLVLESVRNDRLITCLNAAHSTLGPHGVSQILGNSFNGHRDDALKSVEIGHSLVRWGHSGDDLINQNVRRIVACTVTRTQDRDDRWANLVKEAFDIPYGDIRGYVAHGDSVLLAILNRVTRQALRTGRSEQEVLESLSQFDIHTTAAELQREFCALWNEVVQAARNEGTSSPPTQILAGIRRPFTDLHQDTNATPIRFPAPISDDDNVLSWPWSYRLCDVAGHHPNSAANRLIATSHTVPPPTQLSDSPNAPHHPTLPSWLPPTPSRDLSIENATAGNADISVTSGIGDPVRSSDSGGSSALQKVDEAGTMPHPSLSDPLPTPIPTPAPCSADSVVLSPSMGSAPMQADHDHHSLGTPSLASTTIPSPGTPQVSTVANHYHDPRDGTTGGRCDDQDTHLSILSEDHRQLPSGGATGL